MTKQAARRAGAIVLILMVAMGIWSAPSAGQAPPSPATGQAAGSPQAPSSPAAQWEDVGYPLLTLGIGIATVLGLIIIVKVNAFIALITAAIVVSVMAPGPIGAKIARVASEFGGTAGSIGIVIAMAAVIGKCMLDSGAADRVVRAFLRAFGEKRASTALMGSGYLLAIPVFFDTVFYLLVPLARSLHRKTGSNYLLYILAIATGGAITHTLVPPTPGPLFMANELGIDVGVMILVGAMVAMPAAVLGLFFAKSLDRIMPTPMRPIPGQTEPKPLPDEALPPLLLSIAPVLLPVLLISTSTVLNTLADNERRARLEVEDVTDWETFRQALADPQAGPAERLMAHRAIGDVTRQAIAQDQPLSEEQKRQVVDDLNAMLPDKRYYDESAFLGVALNDVAKSGASANRMRMKQSEAERFNRALLESAFPAAIRPHAWSTPMRRAADASNLFGDANLALLLAAVIAMLTLVRQRKLTRWELADVVEASLMSAGVIILITSAGGAFGKMLDAARVRDAVQILFGAMFTEGGQDLAFLFLGFLLAAVLKVAQGSSTVAMIVGSGMMGAILGGQPLDYNAVYLATAIGSGSLVGSWMNDSGFWIFAKMGGLTEVEALKSWTILLLVLAFAGLAMSVILAIALPLV